MESPVVQEEFNEALRVLINRRDQDLLNTFKIMRSDALVARTSDASRLLVGMEQTVVQELNERYKAIPETLLKILDAYDVVLTDQDKMGFGIQLDGKFQMAFGWLTKLLFMTPEFTNVAFGGLPQGFVRELQAHLSQNQGNAISDAKLAWKHGLAKLEKRLASERSVAADPKPAIKINTRTGKIFVAMPMAGNNDHYADTLEAIKMACTEAGFNALRVDDIQSNRPITDDMLRMIDEADYVIADLTDRRPNVFYEAGYAQGIGKTPIFIASAQTELDFDIRGYSVIFFGPKKVLRERIVARLNGLEADRNAQKL